MGKSLSDIRRKLPKDHEHYYPRIEKTQVILPSDQENIIPEPAELVSESFIRRPIRSVRGFFNKLGPGIITGASDDDPSGIGTYSIAGAQFGYQTLWMALATFPLSAAVQEVCARIGLVTGHGLAAVTKKYYSRWILYIVAFLLVCANTINIGADIQAMSATVQLLAPSWNFALIAVGFTALIIVSLVTVSYKHIAQFLKIFTIVLFAYVFVAFIAGVDWGLAFHNLFIPTISFQPAYIMTTVGILGTTISPYMFFWQANEEVEEEISKGIIRKDDPEVNHPGLLKIDRSIIHDMWVDVNVGMFYSEMIMFFIILSTAGTIFKQGGLSNINDLGLAQMANVLRPLVGDTAFLLFAIGIIGIGLLAIPVLAGSASYAVSELFGWKEGLNKKFHEAKGFYAVIILATMVGLSMNFIGINPVAGLYYTAVINGVVAVPLLVIIYLIGNNKKIVGENKSGLLSNFLVILTILIMGIASVAMFTVK